MLQLLEDTRRLSHKSKVLSGLLLTVVSYVATYSYMRGYLQSFNVDSAFISIDVNNLISAAYNLSMVYFLAAFLGILWIGIKTPTVREKIPRYAHCIIQLVIASLALLLIYRFTQDTFLETTYLGMVLTYLIVIVVEAAFLGIIFLLLIAIILSLIFFWRLSHYKWYPYRLMKKIVGEHRNEDKKKDDKGEPFI